MFCRRLLWGVVVVAALAASIRVEAGVSYQDPSGGWAYSYGGTFNAPVVSGGFVGGVGPAGYGQPNDSQALDGTWYHDQSDKWDGSAPGVHSTPNNNPTGTSPGGAAALTDGGTTYIRVQDAGNPEVHGYIQGAQKPTNSNRRVYFGHSIADDYGGAGEPAEPPPVSGRNWQRLLDNGITISFRMRIPNSGNLDDVYTGTAGSPVIQPWFVPPDADYNNNGIVDAADYVVWRDHSGAFQLTNEVPNVTPGQVTSEDYTEWRARFGNEKLGRGYPIHDDGRGMVTILQHNGDENDPFYGTDGTVAFSLLTSKDIRNICAGAPGSTVCSGSGSGGLVMNNRSGDTANQFVDAFDTGQTLNLLPIPDQSLKDWHEFWITIVDNGATAGTHTVNVYMDGSTTPTTFQVTISGSNNGAYANFNAAFLEFGLSSTDIFGSFDMDFLSYRQGVTTPLAAGAAQGNSTVPEPVSLVLIFMAISGLSALRLSHDGARSQL